MAGGEIWEGHPSGGLVRRDIDAAIARAFTCQTFWEQLEKLGYAVKRGPSVKHTAVRPPGGVRFIRTLQPGGRLHRGGHPGAAGQGPERA